MNKVYLVVRHKTLTWCLCKNKLGHEGKEHYQDEQIIFDSGSLINGIESCYKFANDNNIAFHTLN